MVFTSITDEHAVKRHHALTELIQQEADRRGGLSFARFMELALYAPGLGFYEHRGKAIGRKGYFFTSVSVGRLFGELLACQFAHWLGERPASPPRIVEAGAHDGRLAHDILSTLKLATPQLLEGLEYWVLEPSLNRQSWQRETLGSFQRHLRWFQSWTELSSFCDRAGHGLTGVIFANELLDAFPVHRLRWNLSEQKWEELFVTSIDGRFSWVTGQPGEELVNYGLHIESLNAAATQSPLWPCLPNALLKALPDGFTTEVCPAAGQWWQSAARALERGWLLTFDYGLAAEEWFAPQRHAGTVRGYHQHQLTTDVLSRPGQQDITAHVNFSAIQLLGEASGLRTKSHGTQGEFLTTLLREAWPTTTKPFSPEQVRQFQTLTHPQHLGRLFRVLVQTRGDYGAK